MFFSIGFVLLLSAIPIVTSSLVLGVVFGLLALVIWVFNIYAITNKDKKTTIWLNIITPKNDFNSFNKDFMAHMKLRDIDYQYKVTSTNHRLNSFPSESMLVVARLTIDNCPFTIDSVLGILENLSEKYSVATHVFLFQQIICNLNTKEEITKEEFIFP